MATYYVNITSGTTSGTGSESGPFNYNQFVNFLDPDYNITFNPDDLETSALAGVSATDGDVIKVRGYTEVDLVTSGFGDASPSTAFSFFSFNDSLSGTIDIESWDLSAYGPPVFLTRDGSYDIAMFNLGLSGQGYNSELTATIKDFVLKSDITADFQLYVLYGNCQSAMGKKTTTKLKNCAIIGRYGILQNSYDIDTNVSAHSNFESYGCSFIMEEMRNMYFFDEFKIYDSVIPKFRVGTTSEWTSGTTWVFENNISDYNGGLVIVSGDVSNANDPTYISDIVKYWDVSAIDVEHAFFSNSAAMDYRNFNIPTGGATDTFRIDNDYNYGATLDKRLAFGFYAFPPPKDYYVDISNAVEAGYGTKGSPWNYNQLVNFFNPEQVIEGETASVSAVSGDIVNVKGARSNSFLTNVEQLGSYNRVSFIDCHESLTGDIELRGWDVSANGPPVIYNRTDESVMSMISIGDISANPYDQELNIIFKDFMVDDYTGEDTHVAYGKFYIINKTPTESGTLPYVTSAFGDVSFYGCTFDCDPRIGSFQLCQRFTSYDSVFIVDFVKDDYIGIDFKFLSHNIVEMNNNLTTFTSEGLSFTDQLGSPGDVAQYTAPVVNEYLLRYEDKSNFNDQVAYYRDRELMLYQNFNVPVGGSTSGFRESNGYNNGLFDGERTTYGAYAFGELVITSGTGHIGSFYFGTGFNNALITADPAVILLYPALSSIDNQSIGVVGVIKLVAPQVEVTTTNSFNFDFSGTPRAGSAPLIVDFHVYNYYPTGRYTDIWEPYEFRWWFDYGVSGGPNDYVSCATDRAEYTYCGFNGQQYDVRCCVMYRLKT